jgi:hypothetical protein
VTKKAALLLNWKRTIFKRVFAEEGGAPAGGEETPSAAPNTAELIAQARKEEKDKIYPRLVKAEEESKRLSGELSKALVREAGLKTELDSARAKASEAEALKEQIETLTEANKKLKEQAANEAALREAARKEVEAEYEAKLYLTAQLAERKDEILPVFAEEVAGATNEEIDAAIAKAIEKTAKAKKDLGISGDEPEGDAPAPKPAIRKTAPAAKNRTDRLDIEELRNMDVSSPEYAAVRKKLGLDRKTV